MVVPVALYAFEWGKGEIYGLKHRDLNLKTFQKYFSRKC